MAIRANFIFNKNSLTSFIMPGYNPTKLYNAVGHLDISRLNNFGHQNTLL